METKTKMSRLGFLTASGIVAVGALTSAGALPAQAAGKPRPDGCADWEAFQGDLAYCREGGWPVEIRTCKHRESSWTRNYVAVVFLPAIPGHDEIELKAERFEDLPALLYEAIAARKRE